MAVNALLTDGNKTFNPSRKRNAFAPIVVTIGLSFGINWLVAQASIKYSRPLR